MPSQTKRARQKENRRYVQSARAREARRRTVTKAVAVLVVVMLIAGIGVSVVLTGGDDSKSDTTTTTSAADTPTPAASQAPVPEALKDKPQVQVPADWQGVKALKSTDLVVGTGPEATAASTVTVNYVGVAAATAKEFDSSWKGGQPATFPLSGVIKGWQEGIPGMKVGGRRELVIPPDLAYGAQGSPPNIGPNETLVFVVDLLAVS